MMLSAERYNEDRVALVAIGRDNQYRLAHFDCHLDLVRDLHMAVGNVAGLVADLVYEAARG